MIVRNAYTNNKIIDITKQKYNFNISILFIASIGFIYCSTSVEEVGVGVMLNVLGRGNVKGSMLNSFGIIFEVNVKQEYPY
jgi:hypothetical protein